MDLALVALTVFVGVVVAGTGAAKLVALPVMRSRADHLGYSVRSFRLVGVLELAGVAGLVAGFMAHHVAVAADMGLLALLVGAVVSHLRVGDPLRAALPAVVVGVAVLAHLVLSVADLSGVA